MFIGRWGRESLRSSQKYTSSDSVPNPVKRFLHYLTFSRLLDKCSFETGSYEIHQHSFLVPSEEFSFGRYVLGSCHSNWNDSFSIESAANYVRPDPQVTV